MNALIDLTSDIGASRRSFVTGLIAVIAAPAIIRTTVLMPVKVSLQPVFLSIDVIMRESIRLFRDTNQFLIELDREYEGEAPTRYVANSVPHSELVVRRLS